MKISVKGILPNNLLIIPPLLSDGMVGQIKGYNRPTLALGLYFGHLCSRSTLLVKEGYICQIFVKKKCQLSY